tara:strand:- start:731 stop:1504 length:774 start_codon:yes stop_codon:yes gene_type:complete
MKISWLKVVYGGLLSGMPSLIYNPFSENTFNMPLTISPKSLYLNFKLSDNNSEYLNNYIQKYTKKLSITPISLFPNEKKRNYLSINIYNCSSPAFLNKNKQTTRCEINTYIKDNETGKYGTLIIDYLSNELSMDPVNIFKDKNKLVYSNDVSDSIKVDGTSESEHIDLKFNVLSPVTSNCHINTELVKYSDFIYYKNGIYDKLYYDSTLVEAPVQMIPIKDKHNFMFRYKDLVFDKIDSVFFFENSINFVGGMWDNL